MRKRIGTKIFDTEKSIKIIDLPEGGAVYRKKNQMEFFRVSTSGSVSILSKEGAWGLVSDLLAGADPAEYDKAVDLFEKRYNKDGLTYVSISAPAFERLDAYAAASGLSKKSILENLILHYLPDLDSEVWPE